MASKTLMQSKLDEVKANRHHMNRGALWDHTVNLLQEMVDRIEHLEDGSVKSGKFAGVVPDSVGLDQYKSTEDSSEGQAGESRELKESESVPVSEERKEDND